MHGGLTITLGWMIILTAVDTVWGEPGISGIADKSLVWAGQINHLFFLSSNDTEDFLKGKVISTESQIKYGQASSIFAFAYDYGSSILVTVDDKMKVMHLMDITTANGVIFYMGTSSKVSQLTVDWRGRNVYWADGGYGWIAMKALPSLIGHTNSWDKEFMTVVDQFLDTPTGIVVHPSKYFLFWADAGKVPKIERSNLIGGEREMITWRGVITPTTLSIDFEADRLYWTDPGRGTVEHSGFNGENRVIILSEPQTHYYGLALYTIQVDEKKETKVIYTIPDRNLTGVVSHDGRYPGRSLLTSSPRYYVDIFDHNSQPRENEACGTTLFDCTDICTHLKPGEDRGATCRCHDGYDLAADGTSCTASRTVLERHILFTNGTRICAMGLKEINIEIEGLRRITCDVVQHDDTIKRFALDMKKDIVFFTNGERIYKTYVGDSNMVILYNATRTILDMDYDWKTEEIFWTEASSRSVYYLSKEGEQKQKIITTTSATASVRNIAADPYNRYIYVTVEDSGKHKLVRWDKSSTSAVNDTITFFSHAQPNDLEYDRINDRLLWTDLYGVGTINTAGQQQQIVHLQSDTAQAVSVFKKYILTTNKDASVTKFEVVYEISEPPEVYKLSLGSDETQLNIEDVHVFDSFLQPSDIDPCERHDCEHFCLPSATALCACKLGYRLADDNKACVMNTITGDFFLMLDSLSATPTIYQVTMDQVANGDPNHISHVDTHEGRPADVAFDVKTGTVYYVDTEDNFVKRKALKGDSREHVVGDNVLDNSRIAIDVTNGNVYATFGNKIKVFATIGEEDEETKMVVDESDVTGTIGKLALMPEDGVMAWIETGRTTRIVAANMDGSKIKEVVASRIQEPKDLVFDSQNGDVFYWCDSKLFKIEKVDLNSIGRSEIYHDTTKRIAPVAIGVDEEHVYFIPQNQRKIYRVQKTGVLQSDPVYESPLFGVLTRLIVSNAVYKEHGPCSNCNGGCSSICLPNGVTGKKCACADNVELKDDSKTCEHVERCDKQGTDQFRVENCCSDLPNAKCQPVCNTGYTTQEQEVTCVNGHWTPRKGVELKNVCTAAKVKNKPESVIGVPMYAGIAGGVVGLIIIVVIVICLVRSRRKKPRSRNRLPSAADINNLRNARGHDYDTATSQPPQAAPRPRSSLKPPLTPAEELDGGVYAEIDDEKLHPRKATADREDFKDPDRYSHFPKQPHDYIEFSNVGDPHHKGVNSNRNQTSEDVDNEYLTASSSGRTPSNSSIPNGSRYGSHYNDRLGRQFDPEDDERSLISSGSRQQAGIANHGYLTPSETGSIRSNMSDDISGGSFWRVSADPDPRVQTRGPSSRSANLEMSRDRVFYR